MKNFLLLIFISLIFSSCATIFNGTKQNVVIHTKSKVLIDNEKPKKKKGKYVLARDGMPKQVTLQQKGFKDEHKVLFAYKRPWMYWLNFNPYGLVFLAPVIDNGFKAHNYEKEYKLAPKVRALPEKDEDSKYIQLNNVSIELAHKDIKVRHFSTYRNYLNQSDKKKAIEGQFDEDVSIENSVFSDVLNELLVEKKYIDTSSSVFKGSYNNNLLIDATIVDYTIHHVANRYTTARGGMVYIEVKVKWDVLDYYKNSIYEKKTISTSGEFLILDYDKIDKSMYLATKDAIEVGFINFMKTKKVQELLHDKSSEKEDVNMQELILTSSSNYVENLGQAIKSSVTIASDKGHGSGFFISEDGYIVTNYHVVAGLGKAKVVLNNGDSHDFRIVRSSKNYDLALIKIEEEGFVPFKISDSKDFEIALEVYAVGTPTTEDLSQTISKGIISGIRDSKDDSKFIQTDASINGGNSGGALVTKEGLVLAVVSAKLKGFGIEGVAFGIPAYEILDRLKLKFE